MRISDWSSDVCSSDLIGPFSGARLALAAAEADVETSPRCIMHIADQPIMAFAATVREIVAAHRLGILTETARKFTGWAFHAGLLQAALRSESPPSGTRRRHRANHSEPAPPPRHENSGVRDEWT